MKIQDLPVELEVNDASIRGGVRAIATTTLSVQPTEAEWFADAHRKIAGAVVSYQTEESDSDGQTFPTIGFAPMVTIASSLLGGLG